MEVIEGCCIEICPNVLFSLDACKTYGFKKCGYPDGKEAFTFERVVIVLELDILIDKEESEFTVYSLTLGYLGIPYVL